MVSAVAATISLTSTSLTSTSLTSTTIELGA
jgi:hypothetical protein